MSVREISATDLQDLQKRAREADAAIVKSKAALDTITAERRRALDLAETEGGGSLEDLQRRYEEVKAELTQSLESLTKDVEEAEKLTQEIAEGTEATP